MNLMQKLFGKVKILKEFTRFRELGGFTALFRPFGKEICKSDIVRDCIRPLAEQTAKATPKSSDKRIERLLAYRPNPFMNGKDFLAKCRNLLEIKNTLFVYIQRNEKNQVTAFYPVPYQSYEAVEYKNGLFIKFHFATDALPNLTVAWEDLAVARKDYIFSDISGESNEALLQPLELVAVTNQGVANAVKSTANLRGIIKNTKTMLDTEDTKASRDRFVQDYMSLENEGGIAALDPSQEFIPISMSPTVANSAQLREFRENIYRYFGVNDDIVMSKADESVMEAFYSARIEPFLVAFSLELTSKVFSERELGFGAFLQFESSRLEFASNATKLALVQMVDRGALTPNEWRRIFNLAPIEGGDVPIRMLNTQTVNDQPVLIEEGGNEDGQESD